MIDSHFDPKSPSEVIDIGFDMTDLFDSPSVIIVSAVISVIVESGTALSNTLTLVGSPTISGRIVKQRITAGVVKNTYQIICTITCSNGEVMSEASCISVEDKAC